MRATDRLLEVIADGAASIAADVDESARHAGEIVEAVLELRRRGDIVVRSNDLRLIAAAHHGRQFGPGGNTDYEAFDQALERIENALGGRL
jgi:hypothetical protein